MPSAIRLPRLHRVLQVVMGWEGSHLHDFRAGERVYGVPDDEYGMPIVDHRRVTLAEIAPEVGSRLLYTYDIGDDWQHELVVEQIAPSKPWIGYPQCVDGERAGPPEDCGGSEGYARLLTAIKDPADDEHLETLTWLGGSFDPEGFDRNTINRRLSRLR